MHTVYGHGEKMSSSEKAIMTATLENFRKVMKMKYKNGEIA